MKEGYEGLFEKAPIIDKWTFSTNGVAIMGRYGIPCIGFGPGDEVTAHTVRDSVNIEDAVKATEFYAVLPSLID